MDFSQTTKHTHSSSQYEILYYQMQQKMRKKKKERYIVGGACWLEEKRIRVENIHKFSFCNIFQIRKCYIERPGHHHAWWYYSSITTVYHTAWNNSSKKTCDASIVLKQIWNLRIQKSYAAFKVYVFLTFCIVYKKRNQFCCYLYTLSLVKNYTQEPLSQDQIYLVHQ